MNDNFLVKKDKTRNRKVLLSTLGVLLIIVATVGVTYAFFSYTRTGGNNVIETGYVTFDYQDGDMLSVSNQTPMSWSEIETDDSNKLTFTISAHNTLTNGVRFNVYAVYGAEEVGRTRFLDSTMKMKFVAPSDGDGFSITTNNYSSPSAISYTNGKALIATGLVKDTTALTTKSYTLYLWLDSDLAFVSSTTKRATLAEGNPSLADSTSGNTTATRYMRNDSNHGTVVTLYPANATEGSSNKIIYTTNEFSNCYYSIKLLIEAVDV